MGMNWLITGGCGFLGINLIHRLIGKAGHRIIVLDNLSVGTRYDLNTVCQFTALEVGSQSGFERLSADRPVGLLVGDIRDTELALKAVVGADIIIHFAANTGVQPSVQDPRQDMEMNVVGTFNYLEAARQNDVKRFVFASSGAPAGEVEPPIHEELAPHPVSPYGASKLAGEGYCSAYARSFGVETVALRFGNVYGPRSGHKSSVVAKFIRRALNGEKLEVYGDGLQTRDFVYVDDLVEAVMKAATTPGIGGETFQIATAFETNIRELLEHMRAAFEKAGISMPQVVYSEPLVGDVRRNFSDTSKAKRELGWQPQIALPDGLQMTLQDWITSGSAGRL